MKYNPYVIYPKQGLPMLRITESTDEPQGFVFIISPSNSSPEVRLMLMANGSGSAELDGFSKSTEQFVDHLGMIAKDQNVPLITRLDHIALLEIFLAVGTTEGSTVRIYSEEMDDDEDWTVIGPCEKIPVVKVQGPGGTIKEIDLIDYGKGRYLSTVEEMLNAYVNDLQQDYEETGSKQSTEVVTDCSGNRNS